MFLTRTSVKKLQKKKSLWNMFRKTPKVLQEDHKKEEREVQWWAWGECKNSKNAESTEGTNEATSNRSVHGACTPLQLSQYGYLHQVTQRMKSSFMHYMMTKALPHSSCERHLGTKREPVELKLSTLSSRNTIIPSQSWAALQVRGFCSSKVSLPVSYSVQFIPAKVTFLHLWETVVSTMHPSECEC